MPKISTPLTDTFIKNLKATDKAQKYYDGGGLYLFVSPKTGDKFWYMSYRWSDQQKTLSIGGYPVISLAEARAVETAHRVKQFCSQIFRYAVAIGKRSEDKGDPTIFIKNALTPAKHSRFAAITEPNKIGHLLMDIDAHRASIVIEYALKIIPYIFVRLSELRLAKWEEIDLDKKEWRIPASRMKMKVGHIVPLAKQVIELLNKLKPYAMDSVYLFPSPREKTRPITEETLIAAIRHMGYDKETMTVHGFRKMASTRLNEMGFNRDWVERQLAHKERNKIRDAYNLPNIDLRENA